MKALLFVVVLAANAHAQPGLTPPPPRVPVADVELAATFGSTKISDIYAGVLVGGAYRVTPLVWLHGALETTTAPVVHFAGIDQYEGTSDRFAEARAGALVRGCATWLCGFVGIDLGGRHEVYTDGTGHGVVWSGAAVARAGADVGTAVLRARVTIEGTTTHFGDSTALNFGVAYLF